MRHDFIDAESDACDARSLQAARASVSAFARLLTLAERGASGQIPRIARFLAATYNGQAFPLDPFELRAVDIASATTCSFASTRCAGAAPTCTRSSPTATPACAPSSSAGACAGPTKPDRRASSHRYAESARAGFRRPAETPRRARLWHRSAPVDHLLNEAPGTAGIATSGVPAFRQRAFVVLTTIEHPEDGHRPRVGVRGIGDHGAPLVVGDTQAGADVIARHAAQRKERQTLASRDHSAGVVLGDRR